MDPILAISLVTLAVLVAIVLVLGWSVARSRARRSLVSGDSSPASRPSAPPRTASQMQDRASGLPDFAPSPLKDGDRDRYLAAWREVQAIFVEEPRGGILDADRLVENVLRARGYRLAEPVTPVAGAAGEPDVMTHYWAGHRITVQRTDPTVETKDLWGAMADYQAVLDALTEPAGSTTARPPQAPAGGGRSVSGRAS